MNRSKAIARNALLGAVFGLIATLPMSAWMWIASKAGWLTEQAPQTVTRRTSRRTTGRRPSPGALDALTAALHLGIGAMLGSAFSALVGRTRPSAAIALAAGVVYGLVVWVSSYAAILPAVDLMPPPTRDQRRRPRVMVVAHLIFGAVLGLLVSASDQRASAAERP